MYFYRGLINGSDFSYTICRIRTQTPKLSPLLFIDLLKLCKAFSTNSKKEASTSFVLLFLLRNTIERVMRVYLHCKQVNFKNILLNFKIF